MVRHAGRLHSLPVMIKYKASQAELHSYAGAVTEVAVAARSLTPCSLTTPQMQKCNAWLRMQPDKGVSQAGESGIALHAICKMKVHDRDRHAYVLRQACWLKAKQDKQSGFVC